jgi:hypothetical protein
LALTHFVLAFLNPLARQPFAQRRWFDQHPTLSMAISLLQNLPLPQQSAIIACIMDKLEVVVVSELPVETSQASKASPSQRRAGDNTPVRQLIDALEPLAQTIQLDIALHIINASYWIDCHPDASPSNLEVLHPDIQSLGLAII